MFNENNRFVLGHAHLSLECNVIWKGKIVESGDFFKFLNFQIFLKSKNSNFELLSTVTKKQNYEKLVTLSESPRVKCIACQFSWILNITYRNRWKWPKIKDSNFELLFIAATSTKFEKRMQLIQSSYFNYIVHQFSSISDI